VPGSTMRHLEVLRVLLKEDVTPCDKLLGKGGGTCDCNGKALLQGSAPISHTGEE